MFKHTSYDYFQSLIDFAGCALSAAEYLNETILHFDPKVLSARMDAIHSIEHRADDINHRNLDHLAREFLPPVEREDLALLSHEMDDVVDAVDDIMRMLCMYGVTQPKPEVTDMCDLLVRCCREMKTLTLEFRHFKKSTAIKECIVRINTLETEGDTLHFGAVNKLFAMPENPLDILIWRDIFDGFENCYDECEHVAATMESVVLKNS